MYDGGEDDQRTEKRLMEMEMEMKLRWNRYGGSTDGTRIYLVEDALGWRAGAWNLDGLTVRSIHSTITVSSA